MNSSIIAFLWQINSQSTGRGPLEGFGKGVVILGLVFPPLFFFFFNVRMISNRLLCLQAFTRTWWLEWSLAWNCVSVTLVLVFFVIFCATGVLCVWQRSYLCSYFYCLHILHSVCVCACPLNVHAYRPNTGQTHIVMATHTDVNKRGSRVNIVPPLVQQGAIYLNVAMKGSYLHETRAVSGK